MQQPSISTLGNATLVAIPLWFPATPYRLVVPKPTDKSVHVASNRDDYAAAVRYMRRKRHRSIETVVDGAPSWRVSTNLPHHCSTTLRHFCICPLTRMTSATTVSHASYNQLGNSPSLFTDEDMWTIDTILGSDDLLTLDDDIQKDLDFLTSASTISAHPLTILTTPDALMNQAFASESEACFSPQPRPRPRHSLDMMTLETLPLDVLTFVDHPSKRKSFAGLTVVPMMKSMPSLPVQPQQMLNNQSPLSPIKSPKKCKQCMATGCTRRAQSNNRCKSHGGGARCTVAGCGKSSQGGGLCRAHGGGKKCKFPGCTKGTQRLGLCYLHGGIRRCTFNGCVKKDRGNGFCISHGGGKKCSAPKCTMPVTKGTTCMKHAPPPPPVVKMEPMPSFMGRAIAMMSPVLYCNRHNPLGNGSGSCMAMHLLESAYRIEELLSDDDSDSDAEDKRTAITRARHMGSGISNAGNRHKQDKKASIVMAPPSSKAAVDKVFFADVKPFVLDGGDLEHLPQTSDDRSKHVHAQIFGRNNNAKPSPPPPLPAVTLLLPPVSPVVLSARSSANATARRQHPQPSWEVPEPLTTTADEVTTIEAFN
ncbi:hypothetical protein, variant 1 [Aphanomyces astaci]|uniref:WRKY19-like zinc finger domain-containing protein n=1 Tax=Aphanomyces astaci TaxID=112090 RepID=W4H9R2_APHAT|nr:hypothetical protein, variant 1 [Aphanomyces astaci]ETV88306.1 hypothetical protein, variant 1 [Aphanomyces astaci]|eukprot:XP_009823169.1 hypothetical protein, variant 1 [Aphanomyces astaci]